MRQVRLRGFQPRSRRERSLTARQRGARGDPRHFVAHRATSTSSSPSDATTESGGDDDVDAHERRSRATAWRFLDARAQVQRASPRGCGGGPRRASARAASSPSGDLPGGRSIRSHGVRERGSVRDRRERGGEAESSPHAGFALDVRARDAKTPVSRGRSLPASFSPRSSSIASSARHRISKRKENVCVPR